MKVLTLRPPLAWVHQLGDYWTCPRVDFKCVTVANPSCSPPSPAQTRALHPGPQQSVAGGHQTLLGPWPSWMAGPHRAQAGSETTPLPTVWRAATPSSLARGHSPGHVRQIQVLLHLQQDFGRSAGASPRAAGTARTPAPCSPCTAACSGPAQPGTSRTSLCSTTGARHANEAHFPQPAPLCPRAASLALPTTLPTSGHHLPPPGPNPSQLDYSW